MLRHTAMRQNLCRGLLVCSLVLMFPFSLSAQETSQQSEPPAPAAEKAETTGKASPRHMMRGHMQERHEQMEAMHKEMDEELQKQVTALRTHAQTMTGITDTQQLVAEMKRHQQLSDELLGTLVEQRRRMHTMMHEHHEHGHQHMRHQATPGCCPMKQKESSTPPQ
jgi:hypothetical protein